jgi:VWA domain-containing protein
MQKLVSAATVVVSVLAAGSLGRAQSPPAHVRVALLVDTGEGATPALPEIRTGLIAFIDALPPGDEMLLVSTGRRVQVRVPPTSDHKKLKDSAAGLVSDGGPTPLVDALMETNDRFMKKAENPVFVIITGDGSESSVRTDDPTFNQWLQSLRDRRVPAHALVLKYQNNGLPDRIVTLAAQASGGHYEAMSNGKAIPEKMKALAELIAAGRKN